MVFCISLTNHFATYRITQIQTNTMECIMTKYSFLIFALLILSLPYTAYAKMYKYVDQNGNVTYTNTAPPSTAKSVTTSKEIVEDPEVRYERLMRGEREKEKEAALKAQRQRKREIQAAYNRGKAEQGAREQRTNKASIQQQKRQEQAEFQKQYKAGLERLKTKKEADVRNCWERDHDRADCADSVRKRYRDKIATIKNDPERYYGSRSKSRENSSAKASTGIINTPQDNAVINGEWDTQGRHYALDGNGNAWRSDGVFMQKAAGGYINTQTGEFVPAH